jgi:putative chitinase
MAYVLTPEVLQKCFRNASKQAVLRYVGELNLRLQQFPVNTPQRLCMFLAQLGHESGELLYCEEIASGSAYEGRLDLGNTQPGDGRKYKGRGLIQLTGKKNYTLAGLAMDLPLLENPELLLTPANAVLVSFWFFENNNLWSICDSGDFKKLTRRINGGLNGYEHRLQLLKQCREQFPY